MINLVVYAMAGLSVYQSRHYHERDAVVSVQNQARTLAISVSGILEKIDLGLFATVSEVEQQLGSGSINGKMLNEHLVRQLAHIRDLEGMWVSDAAGVIRWGTELPSGKQVNIADRDYFQQLKDHAAPALVISKPVMGRVTKAWSILLSRRINHADGALAGIALGSLRVVDYFTNMFSTIDVGKNGLIALRNDKMELIVRYPATKNPLGQPEANIVSAKALEMIQANPYAGNYFAKSPQDNIERTFSYQKVAEYPLYIFIGLSQEDYLSAWRKEVALTLSLLVAFTLITAFYSWSSTRRANERLFAEKIGRRSEMLERAILGTVDAVSKMTEMRDAYTWGHERRVGEIAAAIALEMGLDQDVQQGLRVAGRVHDVGKISVPTEILTKPGKLTSLEHQIIKLHPERGYEILKDIDFPWPVAKIAHQHHERVDGTGYPNGLKGDEIVLEARILAVADVVEAMASHRPYRAGLGIGKAMSEIERGRGTAYDERAADACLRLFRDKGYILPI